jgi:hypothetical protein
MDEYDPDDGFPGIPSEHRWHYDFAHIALRDFLFQRPDELVRAFTRPDILPEVIDIIAESVALASTLYEDDEQEFREQTRVRLQSFGSLDGCLIEMPEPKFDTECYFIGIVRTGESTFRYFTLERAGGSTKLCAWDRVDRHMNIGIGPAPDLKLFVAAVNGRLKWQAEYDDRER